MDAGAAWGRVAWGIAVATALVGASCADSADRADSTDRGAPPSSDALPPARSPAPSQVAVDGVMPTAVPPAPTDSPATEPPATEPPATEPPGTEPPGTEPPATDPPATDPPDDRAPVRLLFTGDVLIHSPLWRQALVDGAGTYDFAPMLADLVPIIDASDLAICHLETPVAPPFEAYTTAPRYGVPAEVVDSVAAVGFDHCSTASNHTFDRGVDGVEATIARFAQAGITQHGMASTPDDIEPLLIEVGGFTIGHISATYGYDEGDPPPDEPWRSNLIDPTQLIADARQARAAGADLVVVSLHWGDSMSHRASARQREIAGELAMSGEIDLVVGHHAHVVQPIEQLGDMWVAYGLGNLVSNMPLGDGTFSDPSTGDGVVLVVEFTPSVDGRPTITGIVARPIWVDHAAGWVVRDVATARRDPLLIEAIGPELEESWRRTSSVVGALMPVD